MKSLETTDLSDLGSFEEGVLFVTYKYLTRQLKDAKCGVCDASLIPDFTPSATCESCKNKMAKVDWVCPEKCKQSAFCDQCHEFLLIPRAKAVAEWMNGGVGDGDGVMVLDESHSAKISTTVTHLGVCVAREIQPYIYCSPTCSLIFFLPRRLTQTTNVQYLTFYLGVHDNSENWNLELSYSAWGSVEFVLLDSHPIAETCQA